MWFRFILRMNPIGTRHIYRPWHASLSFKKAAKVETWILTFCTFLEAMKVQVPSQSLFLSKRRDGRGADRGKWRSYEKNVRFGALVFMEGRRGIQLIAIPCGFGYFQHFEIKPMLFILEDLNLTVSPDPTTNRKSFFLTPVLQHTCACDNNSSSCNLYPKLLGSPTWIFCSIQPC